MFEKLRGKVALKQSLALGLLLWFLLGTVFAYNVFSLLTQIDNKLNELSYASYARLTFKVSKEEDDRDTICVFVAKDGTRTFSDPDFYDEKTLNEVVDYMVANPKQNGRLVISGRRIAYVVEVNNDNYICGVFDYTKEYSALRKLAMLLIVVGAVGLVLIGFFSANSAKRQIAPVEDAFEKQKDLVANASHELKTPLTVINANLEILKSDRDKIPEEEYKWLEGISEQVTRMKLMVEEMLELAKLESGLKQEVKVPVNLSEVVEEVVLGSEALAFEHTISMNSEIEKDQYIMGVGTQIEKLAYILVENALKYTPEGGVVDVVVKSDRRKVFVRVKNTGDGIPKEDIPKIFDRFYRTDESHHAPDGFGLGLAIAKSIADAHGAEISVNSEVGKYTEFVVCFARGRAKGEGI